MPLDLNLVCAPREEGVKGDNPTTQTKIKRKKLTARQHGRSRTDKPGNNPAKRRKTRKKTDQKKMGKTEEKTSKTKKKKKKSPASSASPSFSPHKDGELGRGVGHATLDNALKHKKSMSGWSEARKRAFPMMESNPNSYFYRFNAPGETQKTGGWSFEEEELFLEKLKDHGIDGRWGLLSMSIPGRVGYQCSNQLRKMINQDRIPQEILNSLKKPDNGPGNINNPRQREHQHQRRKPQRRREIHFVPEVIRPRSSVGIVHRVEHKFVKADRVEVSLPKGLSKQQQKLAAQRISEIQQRFREGLKKQRQSKITEVLELCKNSIPKVKPTNSNYATFSLETNNEEAEMMLQLCEDSLEEIHEKLARNAANFLETVRETIDQENLRKFSKPAPQFDIIPAETKRTRNNKGDESYSEEEEEENEDSGCSEEEEESDDESEKENDKDNPLPEFQDPITKMPIIRPAMSPEGFVIGYDAWAKILRTNGNRCPFTNQFVSRRSLVKLTKSNIEEYRDNIKNH